MCAGLWVQTPNLGLSALMFLVHLTEQASQAVETYIIQVHTAYHIAYQLPAVLLVWSLLNPEP